MANTRTPRPPLPFGTTQEYEAQLKTVYGTAEARSPLRRVDSLASINQLDSLLGTQLRSQLALRGNLGGQQQSARFQENQELAWGRYRTPFVLTCQEWLTQPSPRYLIAAVNPSEIQWQLPQRAVAQKTRVGEIVHYWRDRFRNTFYDEPVLSMTFQSGNIMPMRTKPLVVTGVERFGTENEEVTINFGTRVRDAEGRSRVFTTSAGVLQRGPDPSETKPEVPPGLRNFYDFIELVDTQKILDNGDVNLVYIVYNSRILPNMTLAGLFTPAGISWTDSSTDPNQINSWQASFTVYDSFPRISDKAGLISMFEQAGFGRA